MLHLSRSAAPDSWPSPGFSVSALPGDDYLVAEGEIDLTTAPALAEAIEGAERAGTPCLTVDMGGVTFIDVSGLRVLLSAARRAQAAGHRLAVARPNHMVRRLLELTAIDQSLDITTAGEALDEFE